MAEQLKCAHAACECVISTDGKYGKHCSEHCKENANLTELRCNCRHPACLGR